MVSILFRKHAVEQYKNRFSNIDEILDLESENNSCYTANEKLERDIIWSSAYKLEHQSEKENKTILVFVYNNLKVYIGDEHRLFTGEKVLRIRTCFPYKQGGFKAQENKLTRCYLKDFFELNEKQQKLYNLKHK